MVGFDFQKESHIQKAMFSLIYAAMKDFLAKIIISKARTVLKTER